MVSLQQLPALAPLAEDKARLLRQLLGDLEPAQLHWLAGYVCGLAAQTSLRPANGEDAVAPAMVALPPPRLTVVFGSQTGNARRVAEQLVREAEVSGVAVRLFRADDYPLRELKAERLLYVVISTQGDGEPPDDSRGFVEFVASRRAPRLPDLAFSVLGLGDSGYAKFCQVARDLDQRLAQLGARRAMPRADADVDVDETAQPWLREALAGARGLLEASPPSAKITPFRAVRATSAWSRAKPYPSEVLVNQRISGRDAWRDIRHLELSLQGSGLHYEPGDAVGIWPSNPPELVTEVLELLGLDGAQLVTERDETYPVSEWLSDRRELTRLARPFLLAHAARARSAELDAVLADAEAGFRLLRSHQLLDLLHAFPAAWTAKDLIAALRPAAPRLYSIASSMKVVDDEVHLTVARVDYRAFGRCHLGAASHTLAMAAETDRLPMFIERNERFRLPADSARDIIMIGPGTGVAPFRGFIQERSAVGASGRNWLFFGNPHFRSDFLYQLEWQQALKRGHLQRLDLAFSRDQNEKVYVQDCIRRNAREVFDWIENGACVYVCGDAERMAADVHTALRDVIAEYGNRSPEDADAHLSTLMAERRYLRDVY